jgi:quinol monooxygenase YgiN
MSIMFQKLEYMLVQFTSYLSSQSIQHNLIIHFRAEFIIEQGKTEEYKKLVQEMTRMVEANEPDTMVYQFYLNKDETKCIVHETYTNSEAVLAHNNSVASQTILLRTKPLLFHTAALFGFISKDLLKHSKALSYSPNDVRAKPLLFKASE